jgi:uncharacterized repeat protein (TIGR03803 family)
MSLVQGSNGFLYGTTPQGGTGQTGTVFAMSLEGKLKTLVTFNGTDGNDAYYGLTLFKEIFYGTTSDGGANGYGTLFSMTPQGALTTLYNFSATDGTPNGALLSANGMLCGVTCCGGANGWGTVFSASTNGAVTPIYSFTGGNDGAGPYGGLVQGGDGLFYGTTPAGGAYGLGTVFSVTASGTLTTLYAFSGPDGSNPLAALLLGPDGNFYGTTDYGGANNFYGATGQGGSATQSRGTLFRLSMGLAPFVETTISSGRVGATVAILGTDLTGAGSVTFNGTAATFTVVSATEIRATVPAGALPSNAPFEVN